MRVVCEVHFYNCECEISLLCVYPVRFLNINETNAYLQFVLRMGIVHLVHHPPLQCTRKVFDVHEIAVAVGKDFDVHKSAVAKDDQTLRQT